MTLHRTLLGTIPLALTAFLGCGGDEPVAAEDHTPVTYNLEVEGVAVTAPYSFVAGQMVTVRIKFFNQAGEDLDDVETTHFGGLTFDPSTLATAVRHEDHHYQFEVTGGTAGTGTLVVGFGHDGLADEVALSAAPVTVTTSGSGNPL